MNAKHAIGVAITIAGLFSSAAFAQSASSGFETSWLHLRESHGVGLPAAKSDGTIFVAGPQCSLQRAGGYETSWLHLRETHGVGVKAGEAFAASAGAHAIC